MIFAIFSLAYSYAIYLDLLYALRDGKLSIQTLTLTHTEFFDWHKIKVDNFGLLN